MTLLLIILGTFIAIFERFANAQLKPDFHFKVFIEKNWTLFVLNFLTSFGIYFAVFYGETLPTWKPFWDWDLFNLITILTGTVSLYIWKLLISTYKIVVKKLTDKIQGNNYGADM